MSLIDKDELVKKLINSGLLTDPKDYPTSHYHCSSCSCRGCNYAIEDCMCSSNRLWEILNEMS